jgi:hypothetical protein
MSEFRDAKRAFRFNLVLPGNFRRILYRKVFDGPIIVSDITKNIYISIILFINYLLIV